MSEGWRGLRDVPWGRLVAEFLVIVVGVAVGLAVDSAREASAEADRAGEYLRQVRDDLTVATERMGDEISRSERIADAADRLLDGINQPVLPAPDSLRIWWTVLFSLGTYSPSVPTLDALLEAGDLGLIRDADLRRAIIEYRSRIESARLSALIVDEMAGRAIDRIGEDMSLDNLSRGPGDVRLPLDWEGAASDAAFHSQVQSIQVAASSTVENLTALRAGAEGLRGRIEAALEAG